jgi:hypothetical protein
MTKALPKNGRALLEGSGCVLCGGSPNGAEGAGLFGCARDLSNKGFKRRRFDDALNVELSATS